MEKWMIVYVLPLEVWMDIFCFPWISREEFGRIVDRIGNFKFAEHAQFYLHEWGKRKMGRLFFNQFGFKLLRPAQYDLNLDVPQTSLPENIKSFEQIKIHHFDAKTMDFLTRVDSLLIDPEIEVQLIASKYFNNLRTILSNLAQFLHGRTWLLKCDESALPILWECISREQFTKLRVLKYIHQYVIGENPLMVRENVNTIVDWLTQPELPRFCKIHLSFDNGFSEQFSTAVCQQFQTAKNPSTFAVNLRSYHPIAEFEFHLENGIGEQLHGKYVGEGYERVFQIIRHATNCNKEQLQEWIGDNMKEENRQKCIQISNPTIGPLDAPQMDVPEVDVEQDIQQPSTSKQT